MNTNRWVLIETNDQMKASDMGKMKAPSHQSKLPPLLFFHYGQIQPRLPALHSLRITAFCFSGAALAFSFHLTEGKYELRGAQVHLTYK